MKNDCNRADDLVREFMQIDGMTLAEARATAALSVPVRPAAEWLELIAELDALIGRFCAATGATDEAKASIVAARYTQPLASIPETLKWFRAELARMDAKRSTAAPAPALERNFEGTASAKAACARLHQLTTKGRI